MSQNENQSEDNILETYVSDKEDVEILARGSDRKFVVNDTRILDITEGKSAEGRPLENVESTLFKNVVEASISLRGDITSVDRGQRLKGILMAILGVILILLGIISSAGDISALMITAGLLLILLGLWYYNNASAHSPGGIYIEFYHGNLAEESKTTYRLPENQKQTARAVMRMVGDHDAAENISQG